MSAYLRWSLLATLLLLLTIVPFLLFEEAIAAWAEGFLAAKTSRWLTAAVVAGLLASDIVLPVPSSLLSTAAGYLLGVAAGALVSWVGMNIACSIAYHLGRTFGRGVTEWLVRPAELERAEKAHERLGDWSLILFRAVPVLAEASVLFAGVTRMEKNRFFLLTGLSNLGISLAYAVIGAYALAVESFLLAFAGAVILPGAAMLATRRR